jgi:hypothetical protein
MTSKQYQGPKPPHLLVLTDALTQVIRTHSVVSYAGIRDSCTADALTLKSNPLATRVCQLDSGDNTQ